MCCRNLLHEQKELLGREWGDANIITTNNKTVFSIIAIVSMMELDALWVNTYNQFI